MAHSSVPPSVKQDNSTSLKAMRRFNSREFVVAHACRFGKTVNFTIMVSYCCIPTVCTKRTNMAMSWEGHSRPSKRSRWEYGNSIELGQWCLSHRCVFTQKGTADVVLWLNAGWKCINLNSGTCFSGSTITL